MYYYDRIKELEELSSFDESQPYETDMGGIYKNPDGKGFILITASGCSCWDGDYFEEHFSTFSDLKESLFKDERSYNPTFETAKKMIKEVEEKIGKDTLYA